MRTQLEVGRPEMEKRRMITGARVAKKLVALGIAFVGAAGCDFGGGDLLNASPYLTWPRGLAQPGGAGRVVVLPSRNARPPDKGGTTPRSVGNVRAEAGIPYAVNAQTDDEIPNAISRLVGDAAGSAGIAVVAPTDGAPSALVQTDIAELWCDGYQAGPFIKVYKSNMTLNVHVQDPATRTDRTMVSVHASGGGEACGPAVQQMLGNALRELTTALGAPGARAALVGSGGSAAAAAAPQRCGTGSCKHGRMCVEGTCVDPR